MKRFLLLDVGVGEAVLDHIAKWLTGRPRWTATFLEEFFVRSPKPKNFTTKGIFEDNEKLLVQALDRYIHDMTELDRRQSWTGSNGTARTAIQKAMTTINNRETLNDLELALYHFTFGGNTHLITKSTKYLIEIGVARLKLAGTEDPDRNTYKVTVDEPLMVEAGIRHVGLNTLAKWGLKVRHNSNGEGDSFEEIAVVALRSRLKEVLGTTFPDSNPLAKLSVPTKSSYGVMVKSCKGQGQEKIGDLLDWIDSATSATFEGSVPPFCFPSELFGPDVVCLLRDDDDYQKIGTVLCQAKFKKQQSQTDALRSTVPEWLFYEKKDTTARAMNKNVSGPKLQRWKNDLESKLVGASIPLVHCLVEFPANATRNSQSGRIHRNDIKLCKDPENCKQKLDWLLTVAGQEVDSLFDADFVDMFKAIKGDPQEKPKAGGKRKREQECNKKKKATTS